MARISFPLVALHLDPLLCHPSLRTLRAPRRVLADTIAVRLRDGVDCELAIVHVEIAAKEASGDAAAGATIGKLVDEILDV